MDHAYHADAMKRSSRRIRAWYSNNLMDVLRANKEKQVREVDASIVLAKELLRILESPADKAKEIPLRELVPSEDDSLMKPIEPEVLHLLYGSTEKGASERYLKARYKKSPEDKFFFRVATSWDYGWQQKQSNQRARDVNHGRCAILRDTFYRRNNLAPDSVYYPQPAGGESSICSQYACNAT